MDILQKYNLTPMKVLKMSGLVLLGLIALTVAVKLVGSSVQTISQRGGTSSMAFDLKNAMAPSVGMYDQSSAEMGLSVRNVTGTDGVKIDPGMPPVEPNPTPGDDAEEFEVTSYNAQVETRDSARDCGLISGLKSRDYVIFESANEYDKGCNYSFKVKRESVPEILEVIKSLDPKDLSESTYTIKRLVEDYTSELEILENKLNSINKTLEDAVASYDDITQVASSARDADALAKIINSKIQIIERLTNERINVSAQMERLARSKAEQMDRLAYTEFYVSVYENRFVDGEELADSWKAAVRQFVWDVNQIAQDISINLVSLLLTVLQWALYLLILVVLVKYGWRGVKWIWKR